MKLKLEDINKSYKNKVLDGISFEMVGWGKHS